ncbi:PaaI family thioesterase [Neorhizobium sp. T6_25]|jgi:acyl-coenzyme A thioesterase PaaI-like protein|uniref:PaaI family thioesterase n=1 Tax=Neorhizobium sp. T6_25 TaxID=2093833 RepID=UPI000CF8CEF1|nr:PaaI family thioesterase [Neorhizobium sp. T6_25]
MMNELDPVSEKVFDPAEAGWRRRLSNPFCELIGPFWQKYEGDQFLLGLLCTPNTLNNANVMHGGCLATFCDQALGGTLFETLSRAQSPDAPPVRSVTVQLNVQFLAAVRPFDFVIGRCRITRQTRTLVFLDGLAEVGNEAVASLQAVFKLVKPAP